VVVKAPSGSITFTNIDISSTNVCWGTMICASPQASVNCSQVITESEWIASTTNCPNTYSTNTQCAYFITNWWKVTGIAVDNPGGSGTSACFTPTNPAAGAGTITFYGTWKDSDPCTGQPTGGGTTSKSQGFTVKPPSCLNPHPFSATAYECYHTSNSAGTQCETNEIIENIIDTYVCDVDTNNPCDGICHLYDDISYPPNWLEKQLAWTGTCPGGDASQVHLWQVLWFGCTSCGSFSIYNACEIGQLPPDAVRDSNKDGHSDTVKQIPGCH